MPLCDASNMYIYIKISYVNLVYFQYLYDGGATVLHFNAANIVRKSRRGRERGRVLSCIGLAYVINIY